MLQLLRDNYEVKKILLNKEFFVDLTWFQLFLLQYNGVTYYHQTHCHSQMHLDASLTGLGAVFKNMVYSLPLPRGYMGYNIAQLEIFNKWLHAKYGPAIGLIKKFTSGVTTRQWLRF